MNVVQSSKAAIVSTTPTTTTTTRALPSSSSSSSFTISTNPYQQVPNYELSLDELEIYAIKRLKVLRKMEQWKTMQQHSSKNKNNTTTPLFHQQQMEQMDKLFQLWIVQEDLNDKKIDHISHYILRLAFCQSMELRRWFLQYESILLEHRLRMQQQQQQQQQSPGQSFQRQHNKNNDDDSLQPISNQEKSQLQEKLMKCSMPPNTSFELVQFYKVPYHYVLDLIKHRSCYIHKGYAYIPQSKMITVFISKFRTTLSHQLTILGQWNNNNNNNDGSNGNHTGNSTNPESVRMLPLLNNLHRCLLSSQEMKQDGSNSEYGMMMNGDGLTANNVDQLSTNMPLCMRLMQEGMTKDHKLRHWARQQYGLFLKSAGLSLEDALLYFQHHFTTGPNTISKEDFHKNYSYNIRHMYGKEGKRTDYGAYNCTRIILGNAPSHSMDHHGCPYKHYDTSTLESTLRRLNIGGSTNPTEDRASIMAYKQSGDYQLACQKHFFIQHPNILNNTSTSANSSSSSSNNNNNGFFDAQNPHPPISMENVGNHPNAWFRASVMYNAVYKNKSTSNNNTTTTTNNNKSNNHHDKVRTSFDPHSQPITPLSSTWLQQQQQQDNTTMTKDIKMEEVVDE